MCAVQQIANTDPIGIRHAIRRGLISGQTSGLAPGWVQGNIVILPLGWAQDFFDFCLANPKPCPLLAVGRPGDPSLPSLGTGIDIRHDVPRYRVFRDGDLIATPQDITDLWREDLVTFVIGCSFSFEAALIADGIAVRHIDLGRNVPMFRTNIPCVSAGRFAGSLVVSMRPLTPAQVLRATDITANLPQVHGAPVHFGDPAAIGIQDITMPDFGDAVPVRGDEVPIFWACGVTPQVALANARPPLAITHSPGAMLITDIAETSLRDGSFGFDPSTARPT